MVEIANVKNIEQRLKALEQGGGSKQNDQVTQRLEKQVTQLESVVEKLRAQLESLVRRLSERP